MTNSVPVFVGSTFVDLQPHREAAKRAIQGLEGVVRGMEYFGSLPETPKEECLRIVRSCRIYIGIFAMRYGSVDPATGKSLSQLEYEEAQRIGLPALIYLLDEDRQPVLPKHVEFGEGADKLKALKATLQRNHVITLFTSPEDLSTKITRDLPKILSRNGYEVREGELSKLVASLPRVDWLNEKVFGLFKEELAEDVTPITSDAVLRETLEFILARDNLAATFLITRSTALSVRQAIDLVIKIRRRSTDSRKNGRLRLWKKMRNSRRPRQHPRNHRGDRPSLRRTPLGGAAAAKH